MNPVKIFCSCAVVMALAGHVAGMNPEARVALWAKLGGAATVMPSPSAAPPIAPVVAAPPRMPFGGDAVVVAPDRDGQFHTAIEIEGTRLPALIDTGANFVCLTFEDAAKVGILPLPSDFKYISHTANGPVAYAKTEIAELRLERIAARHVTAFVAPRGALSTTLLGMNFLSKLTGFRVDDGRLVLQP